MPTSRPRRFTLYSTFQCSPPQSFELHTLLYIRVFHPPVHSANPIESASGHDFRSEPIDNRLSSTRRSPHSSQSLENRHFFRSESTLYSTFQCLSFRTSGIHTLLYIRVLHPLASTAKFNGVSLPTDHSSRVLSIADCTLGSALHIYPGGIRGPAGSACADSRSPEFCKICKFVPDWCRCARMDCYLIPSMPGC